MLWLSQKLMAEPILCFCYQQTLNLLNFLCCIISASLSSNSSLGLKYAVAFNQITKTTFRNSNKFCNFEDIQ